MIINNDRIYIYIEQDRPPVKVIHLMHHKVSCILCILKLVAPKLRDVFSKDLSEFLDLHWPDQTHLGIPPMYTLAHCSGVPFNLSPGIWPILYMYLSSAMALVSPDLMTWLTISHLCHDGWALDDTCALEALKNQSWIILLRYAGAASLVVKLSLLPGLWSLTPHALLFFVEEPHSWSFVTMLTSLPFKLGLLARSLAHG